MFCRERNGTERSTKLKIDKSLIFLSMESPGHGQVNGPAFACEYPPLILFCATSDVYCTYSVVFSNTRTNRNCSVCTLYYSTTSTSLHVIKWRLRFSTCLYDSTCYLTSMIRFCWLLPRLQTKKKYTTTTNYIFARNPTNWVFE